MTQIVPRVKARKRTEKVLDARMCLTNHCPFLHTSRDRNTGQLVRQCGAGVFRAELPAEALQDEVDRNPNAQPGYDSDNNPFILRLLMSPDCLRPECGVATIEYVEKVLEVDPEEMEARLFQ